MAFFKSNDSDTATVTSSGSVVADPRKLLSLKRVQKDLAKFDALYERESKRQGEHKVVRAIIPDAIPDS